MAWSTVDAYFKSRLGFKVTLWCFLCPGAELTESHDSFVRQSADIFGPVRWPYAAEKISGATETINVPGSAACEKPSYRPQSVAFRHAMESVKFRTVSLEVDDGRCTVYGDIVRKSVIIAGVRVRVCVSVPCPCSCSAWKRTCSVDIDMQHWHGHSTWAWSMDIDMQHWHGHAAWTWIWTRSMDPDTQYGLGHAAWTWACSMDFKCSLVMDLANWREDPRNRFKMTHSAEKTAVESLWPGKVN
jgi:hypothetical protein